MNICDIFTKTLSVGITTNYTQRNKGYGLCPMGLSQSLSKKLLTQPLFVFCVSTFDYP